MKMLIPAAYTLILSIILHSWVYGQTKTTDNELNAVFAQDSLLWLHYNACEMEKLRSLFTDDIEFYHDKGGPLKGLDNLISTSQKNLCGNENFRIRRDAVPGTIKAFPMTNNGEIYGAILTGEHLFYILEKGKTPRLDGRAKFTHLFLKAGNEWKMSRVLSYDHGPAPWVNERTEILLREESLRQHAGIYEAPKTGKCVVTTKDNYLNLVIGNKVFMLHPETETKFFVTDRDLTFEFVHDQALGKNKMIVRENNILVEEAVQNR
jgi:hypothetical protein